MGSHPSGAATVALPHLNPLILNEQVEFGSKCSQRGCFRKIGVVYVSSFISSHTFLLVPALALLRPYNQLAEEVSLAEN